jgi:hypothetical protein
MTERSHTKVRERLDDGLYEYPDDLALVDDESRRGELWAWAYEQVADFYNAGGAVDHERMAAEHMDEVRDLVDAYVERLRRRKAAREPDR